MSAGDDPETTPPEPSPPPDPAETDDPGEGFGTGGEIFSQAPPETGFGVDHVLEDRLGDRLRPEAGDGGEPRRATAPARGRRPRRGF